MGRTYEALEKAQRASGREKTHAIFPKGRQRRDEKQLLGNRSPSEIYENIAMNIIARCAAESLKVVLFAGVAPGDGSSTTAAHVAMAMARNARVKVLLMDVNLHSPTLHTFFPGADPMQGPFRTPGSTSRGAQPQKVGPGNLYLSSCTSGGEPLLGFFESKGFHDQLILAREGFDYVVLDGPPFSLFSEARTISSQVDAVVLVIRSGWTHRMIALKAKECIEEAGSKPLGVILNRRRFYIPWWIYRRL